MYCIAGKEDNIGMNAVGSDWDEELTSAAMSAAAVSAAAAAAADDDGDAGDGWQMCNVETRPIPLEFYSYVSIHLLEIVRTDRRCSGPKQYQKQFWYYH